MNNQFLNNKYTKWYFQIIDRISNMGRKKLKKIDSNYQYFELHHIIPKSIGGVNNSSNYVLLTPREHYVCHLLLTKMCISRDRYKMLCAYHRITNRNKQQEVKSSRLYDSVRKEFAIIQSENNKGDKNHFYGKSHLQETKEHLSRVCPRFGKENGNYGKSLSQSHRDAISRSNKSREIVPPPPQLGSRNYFSKYYEIIDSLGNHSIIHCMKTFCLDNNLCSRTMIKFKDSGKIPVLKFEREYRVKNLEQKRNCEGYTVNSIG